jgi:integrase/recombinase XerD
VRFVRCLGCSLLLPYGSTPHKSSRAPPLPGATGSCMIDTYFEDHNTLRFLRSGRTGPHIDAFSAWLSEVRYASSTARGMLRDVVHLGLWMETNGIDVVCLDEGVLESFFAHFPICRCVGLHRMRRQDYAASCRRFLTWARNTGVVITAQPVDAVPPLITEFEEWMVQHRNVAPNSLRDVYRFPLRRLLGKLGDDPGRWDAAGIRRFILDEAQHVSAKPAVTATRQMLRFLAMTGRCPPDLVYAPPKIARWGLDVLPLYISREDVDRIIATCDQETASGCQDRAMILLMARIGLRAADVAALCLSDLHWSEGTVSVFGKSRRASRLPLPQDAGDAILAWLREHRPPCDDDHVFVCLRPPIRPFPDGQPISARVARAARNAVVNLPRAGSHVLRHSAATALLDEGMSLAAIGALLRHKSLDTTAVYAKVDVGLLSSVARAWPSSEVTP